MLRGCPRKRPRLQSPREVPSIFRLPEDGLSCRPHSVAGDEATRQSIETMAVRTRSHAHRSEFQQWTQ